MTAEPHLHAWIDATAGIAGDMLLAALLDAGASLESVRAAVAAVIPGEARLQCEQVTRAGLRASKVDVVGTDEEQTDRSWADISSLLRGAPLDDRVRDSALAAFAALAEAEARVHGVAIGDVHFHEVGSWDSIADIVGVCAALADLGVASLTASPVALGSGRIRAAHGEMPVPAPAVLELARGWEVVAGGDGELATPTGMALLRALADGCGPIPAMAVGAVGVGAGTRDPAGRANVVRVAVGQRTDQPAGTTRMWLLETNVDDLDPRVWPSVIASLLESGAADAWLVPIVMKKGRPAHTLSVLAPEAGRAALRDLVFRLTSTIGVRETPVSRTALEREWATVDLGEGSVRIKVAHRAGEIVHATPEFDDVAQLAATRGMPVRQVLDEAVAAAEAAGLRPGQDLKQR